MMSWSMIVLRYMQGARQRPVAVPKFGVWEEQSAAAQGFTVQFDRVKRDREVARAAPPGVPRRRMPSPESYAAARRPRSTTFYSKVRTVTYMHRCTSLVFLVVRGFDPCLELKYCIYVVCVRADVRVLHVSLQRLRRCVSQVLNAIDVPYSCACDMGQRLYVCRSLGGNVVFPLPASSELCFEAAWSTVYSSLPKSLLDLGWFLHGGLWGFCKYGGLCV